MKELYGFQEDLKTNLGSLLRVEDVMGDEEWEYKSFQDFVETMHGFRMTVLKQPKNCSTAIEC